MYRTSLAYLKNWKTKAVRKPLVIRGARQVGKSFLVRMFAAESFENLLEINLETDLGAPSLFSSMDPAAILPLLEARYSQSVRLLSRQGGARGHPRRAAAPAPAVPGGRGNARISGGLHRSGGPPGS
ncbi:MAG: AAA family ATPase [Elusimicrobia bacterium]|nr:AAA family ATPase [Elusimicrobiota bacterium]